MVADDSTDNASTQKAPIEELNFESTATAVETPTPQSDQSGAAAGDDQNNYRFDINTSAESADSDASASLVDPSETRSGAGAKAANMRRQRNQSKNKIVGIVIAAAVVLVVGISIMVMNGGKPNPDDQPDPNNVDKKDHANIKQPPKKPPVKPKKPQKDPQPKSPLSPDIKHVVILEPDSPLELGWQIFDAPQSPFTPSTFPGQLATHAAIRKISDSADYLNITILSENATVHEKSLLRLQILNDSGQAYAELLTTIPYFSAANGLNLSIPIDHNLALNFHSAVIQLEPGAPLPDKRPLIAQPAATKRIAPKDDPRHVLSLTISNPFSQPINNPNIQLEVFSVDGRSLGIWSGAISAPIPPGKSLAFQATPPIPPGKNPARIQLRSYGSVTP